MKIALPSKNGTVDNHFGHCEYFTIYTIENSKIIAEETLNAPTGCGCKSNVSSILAQMGVKILLAGNMGQGAVNALNSQGIEVVRGCMGNTKEIAEAWLDNKISDSGQGCSDHGGCNH